MQIFPLFFSRFYVRSCGAPFFLALICYKWQRPGDKSECSNCSASTNNQMKIKPPRATYIKMEQHAKLCLIRNSGAPNAQMRNSLWAVTSHQSRR
jgi:hypothetical protein